MFLPSAVACEASQPLAAAHFASPPASPQSQPPPQAASLNLNNLFATCRSLQALLAAPAALPSTPPASAYLAQLPSPPLAHASPPPPPPLKLRLRPRKPAAAAAASSSSSTATTTSTTTTTTATTVATTPSDIDAHAAPQRISKRANAARPLRTRRRRDTEPPVPTKNDLLAPAPSLIPAATTTTTTTAAAAGPTTTATSATILIPEQQQQQQQSQGPHTPKRSRIAPAVVPLGLERGDFHDVHEPPAPFPGGTDVEAEADGSRWSAEDDHMLVELVLEKMQLSREEWHDCARSLGRDKASLGRRWKTLLAHGDVGLRQRSRRGRIHGTWR